MVHNQSKYWIAIKANLFRDRVYFPEFSPPKATSIQWGLQEENKKFLLPLTVNQFIAMTSTHKTGNNTSVRNAVNSDNLPNIYIATDLGSSGMSYYIAIGT